VRGECRERPLAARRADGGPTRRGAAGACPRPPARGRRVIVTWSDQIARRSPPRRNPSSSGRDAPLARQRRVGRWAGPAAGHAPNHRDSAIDSTSRSADHALWQQSPARRLLLCLDRAGGGTRRNHPLCGATPRGRGPESERPWSGPRPRPSVAEGTAVSACVWIRFTKNIMSLIQRRFPVGPRGTRCRVVECALGRSF